ncbi:MAG: DMT family transporter [Desulfobulbaceae bacterium]|nr:MAG: DMT family transporter [Desulfobulbaceae bacterium]
MLYLSTKSKGVSSALLSATILATTGILIRYLIQEHQLEPMVLAFWRNLFLVTVLLIILECFYPRLVEISWGDFKRFVPYGVVLALFNYLWTNSVALNGAAVATFLVYSSVPFTALLAKLLLGEYLSTIKLFSVGAALIGCLFVSCGADFSGVPFNLNGLLLGLGSGLCFAMYSTLGKDEGTRGTNPWTLLLYTFGIAAVLLFGAQFISLLCRSGIQSVADSFFSLGFSASGWGVLLLLAVGPTLLGFGLYNVSLGYLPANLVNLIATSEPPITAVLAYLLFGEILTPLQVGGSTLIIGAIVISSYFETERKILPKPKLKTAGQVC